MSGGPVGVDGNSCTEATKYDYVNLEISEKEWCTYRGDCDKEYVSNQKDICLFCQYRKDLNIPAMILAKMKEKYDESFRI